MILGVVVAVMVGVGSCCGPAGPNRAGACAKVEIDLTQLDEAGLRGPPDGKVAVAYEFVIPNADTCRAKVAAIDPTGPVHARFAGTDRRGQAEC